MTLTLQTVASRLVASRPTTPALHAGDGAGSLDATGAVCSIAVPQPPGT